MSAYIRGLLEDVLLSLLNSSTVGIGEAAPLYFRSCGLSGVRNEGFKGLSSVKVLLLIY